MSKEKKLVIITSVIYFKDKKLSYSDTRSVYSPEERILQTLKTIQTVKEKIPGTKILFLEAGMIDIKGTSLLEEVDEYLYLGDKLFIKLGVNSIFKGLGEVLMLIYSFKKIHDFDRIYKISGRYYLNKNFLLNDWDYDGFIFKKINNIYLSTRFYSFSKKVFNFWFLISVASILFLIFGRSIEWAFGILTPNRKLKKLNIAGVSGNSSCDGVIIQD